MAWIPLESSVIAAVRYDANARRLDVRFTSGELYRYSGVPASVMRAFMAAPSAGEFFNAEIRGAYPFEHL